MGGGGCASHESLLMALSCVFCRRKMHRFHRAERPILCVGRRGEIGLRHDERRAICEGEKAREKAEARLFS